MVVVNIRIDGLHQFQKSLRNTNSHVNKRCQQALNRTLQRSRTKMTNMIGEKLNLRKKTIREVITIQKANKNTGLIGKLTVKHRPVPLIEYNAKQNTKGVSVTIFKIKPRSLIKHAFIYLDKHKILRVSKRDNKSRLKIKPLYGTSIKNASESCILRLTCVALDFFKSECLRLVQFNN